MGTKKVRVKHFKDLDYMNSELYYIQLKTMHGSYVSGNVREKEGHKSVLYLSTHMFYKGTSDYYEKALNELGFNVEVVGY